ncbi:hypothetical protein Tco_0564577 [Tanacetum coccineum]
MAGASLNMSLDDLIKNNKNPAAVMPKTIVAMATNLVPDLLATLIIVVRIELLLMLDLREGVWDGETRTKLYISNVDYSISNVDIKEIFAEVEKLTKKEVDGETIMKLETKMIAKDGTVFKLPGKFPGYTPSKEEEEPEKKGTKGSS